MSLLLVATSARADTLTTAAEDVKGWIVSISKAGVELKKGCEKHAPVKKFKEWETVHFDSECKHTYSISEGTGGSGTTDVSSSDVASARLNEGGTAYGGSAEPELEEECGLIVSPRTSERFAIAKARPSSDRTKLEYTLYGGKQGSIEIEDVLSVRFIPCK